MAIEASLLKEVESVLNNIRKIRELKNITRDQLAADVGMSTSGYAKIERCEIELTLSRLYQIAQALELKVQELLDFNAIQMLGGDEHGHANAAAEIGKTQDSYETTIFHKYIEKLEDENLRLKTELTLIRGDLPYEKPNHLLRKNHRF